jgi:hypothetical protein
MIYFNFGLEVINDVIRELEKAEKYIKIAIFQLHNLKVFDVLSQRLKSGVAVEIFTLPYDSINEDIQNEVKNRFITLQELGAELHFCKWNIGDPERTSTAVGRWYSYHGKFIVTDKSAISLSANFTEQSELDALLIYTSDSDKIVEYNNKFDELMRIFIDPSDNNSGEIRKLILETGIENVQDLFKLPRIIQTNTHKDHWIKDYPAKLCPSTTKFDDGLYICPFNVKGRNLITKLIAEANQFIYISTESFTDVDIADYLIKKKLENIDMKIITGATSMDFTDRMQKMLRNLLANGININTSKENLHAKLIITDKGVAVSSINFNKIGLGFYRGSQLWRENTETIAICREPYVINNAKLLYKKIFDSSIDISIILSERIEIEVANLFNRYYGLRSRNEVKKIFSRLVLQQEIDVRKTILKIVKITSKLMMFFHRTLIGRDDFLMALILFYLSERKLNYNEIIEKVGAFSNISNYKQLLLTLINGKFIEEDGDYYKLRVDSLF